MTRDSDFKDLVRRRMAETGENYTTARAALDPEASAWPEGASTEPPDDGPGPVLSPIEPPEPPGRSLASYLDVDPGLSVDDVLALGSMGVEPSELAEHRATDPDISLEDVLALHSIGVTSSVTARWRELLPDVGRDAILGATSLGITPETYAAYRGRREDITLDQVLALHSMGVQP